MFHKQYSSKDGGSHQFLGQLLLGLNNYIEKNLAKNESVQTSGEDVKKVDCNAEAEITDQNFLHKLRTKLVSSEIQPVVEKETYKHLT